MRDPQVDVNVPPPEVNVQRADQPQVRFERTGEPRIQYNEPQGQPRIRYERMAREGGQQGEAAAGGTAQPQQGAQQQAPQQNR